MSIIWKFSCPRNCAQKSHSHCAWRVAVYFWCWILCSRVNLRKILFHSFSPRWCTRTSGRLGWRRCQSWRARQRTGCFRIYTLYVSQRKLERGMHNAASEAKKLEVELNQARLMRPCESSRRTVCWHVASEAKQNEGWIKSSALNETVISRTTACRRVDTLHVSQRKWYYGNEEGTRCCNQSKTKGA